MNEKQMLQHAIDEKQKLQHIVDVLSAAYSSLIFEVGSFVGQKYKGNYQSAIHAKNKSYPFIPYPSYSAVEQIYVAFNRLGSEWNKYSFLDAGCGIGNIMLLANKAGFIAHGLEIDPTILKTASKINRSMFLNMEKQSIMTYKHYGYHDVIYYYCPYASCKKERLFEERVENEMKVGAIVIPNYKISKELYNDKRFESIPISKDRHPIYIKIKT